MRALAIVHKYAPIHNAGAEWMLHAIFRDWTERGADCFVVYPGAPSYELHGVTVGRQPARELDALVSEVDVVVTHLDNTGAATRAARRARKPVVHLVHNDRQLQYHNVKPAADTLIVSNSYWIHERIPARYRPIVCRPPVFVADYVTERPDAELVTLINRTEPKGAHVLYRIAEAEPARRFLAVEGAYGHQVRPPSRCRNVELMAQTPNVRDDVYARTRVLLMPSSYESWGRVAIEAACSGIPTIAHPTPGLTEALGDAGIFADRARIGDWRRALRELDDAGAYAQAGDRARARALELAELVAGDLDALAAAVTDLTGARFYDAGMAPILGSGLAGMRTAALCPICKAERCSCTSAGVKSRVAAVNVTDAARPDGQPPKVYRTWRGDFRFSVAGAQRAGLLPVPGVDTLPSPVARQLAKVADVEELDRAYARADAGARERFLAGVALVRPAALGDRIGELVADLKSSPAAAGEPSTSVPAAAVGEQPPTNERVGVVLDWAGEDRARLEAALEAERGGRARTTLITELERRLAKG